MSIWDQWPTIQPFYEAARKGGRVYAIANWFKENERTRYAYGRVEAYDEFGGTLWGLKGLLDQPLLSVEEGPGGFYVLQPLNVQTFSLSWPSGQVSLTAKVEDPSSGSSYTLSDPSGGPFEPGPYRDTDAWAWLGQTEHDWSEGVDLSFIRRRPLLRGFRGDRELSRKIADTVHAAMEN